MSEPFLLAIVSQILQVTVVAMIALLLCRIGFRRAPKFVYRMTLLVLLSFLIPPVIFSPFPSVGSLIEKRVDQFRLATSPPLPAGDWVSIATQGADERWIIPAWQIDPRLVFGVPLEETAFDGGSLAFVSLTPTNQQLPPTGILIGFIAAGIYGTGLILVVCRDLYRIHKTRRKMFADSTTIKPAVNDLFLKLKQKICPQRTVRLLASAGNCGPVSFGVLRPVVIVPNGLLEHDDLELILAHELVHIRRYDYIASVMQMICVWVWWFHPLVHRLSSQSSLARETQVDGEVIFRSRIKRGRYANCLLDIASHQSLRLAFNQMGAVSKRQLENRLRLISHGHHKSKLEFLHGFIFILFILILIPDRSLSPPDSSDGLVVSAGWHSDRVPSCLYRWSAEKPVTRSQTHLNSCDCRVIRQLSNGR